MPHDETKPLARRQVLGAGVAGAALLALPEGCSQEGTQIVLDAGGGTSVDVSPVLDVGVDSADSGDGGDTTDATGSADSGVCPAADYTRQVNIADAGIANQGTAYAFSDSCFTDSYCGLHRIILIHPVTQDVYVAMSGSCTHDCNNVPMDGCGPTYYPSFTTDDAGVPEAGAEGGAVLKDVIYCNCHGSVFDAVTGDVIHGPAGVPLQVLKTSESGGFVDVEIPKG
jgi:Rieske Fe-S protein